jgi:hypothetical protein
MSLHRPHFFRQKKWISFISVLRANWDFQVKRTCKFLRPIPLRLAFGRQDR